MSKSEKIEEIKSDEIVVENIAKVALKQDESVRIIVTQFANGQLQVGVKSKERVMIPQLIGLVELAKNDMIQSTLSQPEPKEEEMITFKLDQLDFDLDTEGYLKSQNLSVGDDFTMSKLMFDLREKSRSATQKEN